MAPYSLKHEYPTTGKLGARGDFSTLIKLFCALGIATTAVGCGGGTSSQNTTATVQEVVEPPTSLRVVFEARNGKTTIDAWFQSELQPDAVQPAADSCELVTHTATTMQRAIDADTDIRVVSRDGDTARLVAHQTGGMASYQMEQRWLDDPVPDDAVLMFTAGSEFKVFDSTPLPTLQPLTWSEPVLTAPTTKSSTLTWESATASDTVIKLNLSAMPDNVSAQQSGVLAPVLTPVLSCTVIDDGEFTLSAEWQVLLGNGADQMLMRAKRVRAREFVQGEKRLSVLQVAHTDLVKP